VIRISKTLFLGATLAASLIAGEWDKKPFPNWDRQQVLRILVDSPWAKSTREEFNFERAGPARPVTWKDLGVPGDGGDGVMNTGSPVGGIGRPLSKEKIELDVNVRWSSALPIKQATALTKYGEDGLKNDEARMLLQPEESFYVLEISGVPAAMAFRGIADMQAKLFEDARLFTGATDRSIPPAAVYITNQGSGLLISLRFSKEKPITLKDKELLFRAEYSILKLERKFKLKQMVYNGKLEL
jgi:hypothetical protein